MRVKIDSEDELHKVAGELLKLIVNTRQAQKSWERDYGHHRKAAKKYWEDKLDTYLMTLAITGKEVSRDVKIVITDEK